MFNDLKFRLSIELDLFKLTSSVTELNSQLWLTCQKDANQQIATAIVTIGTGLAISNSRHWMWIR